MIVFGFIFLWGPLVVAALAAQWMLVCAIWAPFAAAITIVQARRQQRNIWLYGMTAAFYSILFLPPWLYLVIQMSGKTAPRVAVLMSLILAYSVWTFMVWGILWLEWNPWTSTLALLGSAIGLLSILRSRTLHNQRSRWNQGLPPSGDDGQQRTMIAPAHLVPFICAHISVLLYLAHVSLGAFDP